MVVRGSRNSVFWTSYACIDNYWGHDIILLSFVILGIAACFINIMIIKVSGATARWPFTDSAVPSSLLLLLFLFLLFF